MICLSTRVIPGYWSQCCQIQYGRSDLKLLFNSFSYRQTSNISCTLIGNKLADHSDVVGASPVGTAPTTSSFSTLHPASMDERF